MDSGFRRELSALVGGLSVRIARGRAILDRPAAIGRPVVASVRGLAGRVMLEHRPELFHRWFKPEANGHAPPSYVFEGLQKGFGVQDQVAFIVTTWDGPNELLAGLAEALTYSKGYPFGESGARIREIQWEGVEVLSPEGSIPGTPASEVWLGLEAPIRIKADNRWVSEKKLSAEHFTLAAVRRLNQLSESYGNGRHVDLAPFRELSKGMRETERSLKWVRPRRRSATQEGDLSLSGVVGTMGWREVPAEWIALMQAARPFHLGARATDGCGHYELGVRG